MTEAWRRLVYCPDHRHSEPVATVLESHKRRYGGADAYDVKAVLECGAPVHIIASTANLREMQTATFQSGAEVLMKAYNDLEAMKG